MKIINERGKLFGLINVVDLLVLLAILAVAGGIGWKIFAPGITEKVSPTADLTAEVRVRGVHSRMIPEIEKNLPSQIIAGNAYVDDAYITGVRFEQFRQQNATADGQMVDAGDPVRVDAIFTIEAKVPRDSAVIKIGPQEVRAGYGYFVKTKFIEFSGNFDSVTLK